MKVRQHIPGFVSGVEPDEATVTTLAELLALPWVSRWATDPTFHRFSVSNGRLLMAEQNGGANWWVVAYLDGAPSGLPAWARPTSPTSGEKP